MWKLRVQKGEFVKNDILETWILWKLRFQKCEFCENWDFQYVDFWIKCGFLPQRAIWIPFVSVEFSFPTLSRAQVVFSIHNHTWTAFYSLRTISFFLFFSHCLFCWVAFALYCWVLGSLLWKKGSGLTPNLGYVENRK